MAKFLFVRHGEPDYPSVGDWSGIAMCNNFAGLTEAGIGQIKKSCEELKKHKVDLIISSPFTRTLQGATIMARELNAEVVVEHNLHEWQADLTYSITDEEELASYSREYYELDGKYPEGETRLWETKEMVRKRVLECLEKYRDYECVVVSGHGMMTQAVVGEPIPVEYGQVVEIEI